MGSTGGSQVKTGGSSLTKSEQLDIILNTNPAEDDMHTWIREESDILTFAEAFEGGEVDPDFTDADIDRALRTGKVTVYSSKPIVNGNFISPSAMEAAAYSGTGTFYMATVSIDDVAWIDDTQGQIATRNNIKFKKVRYRQSRDGIIIG